MQVRPMYQHHIEKLTRTRLDDVLLDEGILERSRIADAQAEHEMTGKSLTGILLDQLAIDEWDLAKVIITHYSLPFLDLTDINLGIDPETVLPLEFCRAHMVLPLDLFGSSFTLAVCEMPSTLLLQKIIEVSGKSPFLYVAVRRQIVDAIDAIDKRMLRKGPGNSAPAPAAARPVARPAVAPVAAVPAAAPSSHRRAHDDATLVPIHGILPVSMKLSASVAIRSRRATQESRPVAANPAESGWQSIFDIGDDAVRSD